jgi:DNA repair ATPase RecN
MATDALDKSLHEALDRIEQALARLEAAVVAAPRVAENTAEPAGELTALRTHHRKLKDTVSKELQQLDLLLANLPQ